MSPRSWTRTQPLSERSDGIHHLEKPPLLHHQVQRRPFRQKEVERRPGDFIEQLLQGVDLQQPASQLAQGGQGPIAGGGRFDRGPERLASQPTQLPPPKERGGPGQHRERGEDRTQGGAAVGGVDADPAQQHRRPGERGRMVESGPAAVHP
jgi:hypothetical protein